MNRKAGNSIKLHIAGAAVVTLCAVVASLAAVLAPEAVAPWHVVIWAAVATVSQWTAVMKESLAQTWKRRAQGSWR